MYKNLHEEEDDKKDIRLRMSAGDILYNTSQLFVAGIIVYCLVVLAIGIGLASKGAYQLTVKLIKSLATSTKNLMRSRREAGIKTPDVLSSPVLDPIKKNIGNVTVKDIERHLSRQPQLAMSIVPPKDTSKPESKPEKKKSPPRKRSKKQDSEDDKQGKFSFADKDDYHTMPLQKSEPVEPEPVEPEPVEPEPVKPDSVIVPVSFTDDPSNPNKPKPKRKKAAENVGLSEIARQIIKEQDDHIKIQQASDDLWVKMKEAVNWIKSNKHIASPKVNKLIDDISAKYDL